MEQNKATRWEIGEKIKLKNLYATMPMNELVDMFGRSQYAIHSKAYKLGLKREKRSREKLVQCFVTVKGKHVQEVKSLINKTIKKWR